MITRKKILILMATGTLLSSCGHKNEVKYYSKGVARPSFIDQKKAILKANAMEDANQAFIAGDKRFVCVMGYAEVCPIAGDDLSYAHECRKKYGIKVVAGTSDAIFEYQNLNPVAYDYAGLYNLKLNNLVKCANEPKPPRPQTRPWLFEKYCQSCHYTLSTLKVPEAEILNISLLAKHINNTMSAPHYFYKEIREESYGIDNLVEYIHSSLLRQLP